MAEPLVTLTSSPPPPPSSGRNCGSSVWSPRRTSVPAGGGAASLDAASDGGRVVAGFGNGLVRRTSTRRRPCGPFAERGRALDELINVAPRGLGPDPVVYDGEFTRDRVRRESAPVRPPR
ncbi:hypothetical protein LV779_11805 [Streptomyces thinghirensis]|nr:hypothetical protein [Streptomyces thinghirensis]